MVNISNSYQCIFSNVPTSPRPKSAHGRYDDGDKFLLANSHDKDADAGYSEDHCKECQEDVACIAYDLAGNVVQLLVHIMK